MSQVSEHKHYLDTLLSRQRILLEVVGQVGTYLEDIPWDRVARYGTNNYVFRYYRDTTDLAVSVWIDNDTGNPTITVIQSRAGRDAPVNVKDLPYTTAGLEEMRELVKCHT